MATLAASLRATFRTRRLLLPLFVAEILAAILGQSAGALLGLKRGIAVQLAQAHRATPETSTLLGLNAACAASYARITTK